MTDEAKTKAQTSQTDRSSVPSKSTPATNLRMGDPPRRGLGDQTDDESQRTDRSKAKSFDEETDADDGEGHKGPYAATNSDSDASHPRSESSQVSEVKPARPQGGSTKKT